MQSYPLVLSDTGPGSGDEPPVQHVQAIPGTTKTSQYTFRHANSKCLQERQATDWHNLSTVLSPCVQLNLSEALYMAFVRPHLEYASPVRDPH